MIRAALLSFTFSSVAWAAGQEIPLFFMANQGQAPADVRFMVKAQGVTAWFLRDQAIIRTGDCAVRMQFEGATPHSRVQGQSALAGRANFLASNAAQSHLGIPLYGSIRYDSLYPGIDLAYAGSSGRLKSDF